MSVCMSVSVSVYVYAFQFRCLYVFVYIYVSVSNFNNCFSHYLICGQTYSRKVDVDCVNTLASLAATVHKVRCSM